MLAGLGMDGDVVCMRGDTKRLTDWNRAAWVAWLPVAGQLAFVVVLYASYATDVIGWPFGLNYSEGLIWQQALWMFTPRMYPDIAHYPFLVFEYPPLYHLLARGLAACGMDMLAAGRIVSLAGTVVSCGLIGWVTMALARPLGRGPARAGGVLAGLLPLTLLPVIAWSVLMRVDMLGLALTYAGIALGSSALDRPSRLTPAMLCFVAACYTKQTFLAAPVAMFGLHLARRPRAALRAGVVALAIGLLLLLWLQWLTQGGFLRHIVSYNVNRFSLAIAVEHGAVWFAAYPVLALLTLAGLFLWRRDRRVGVQSPAMMFWVAYLALSTVTLIFSGKSGASINYFVEWLCIWCVWTGWVAARAMAARGWPSALVAASLAAQLWLVPGAIRQLHAAQLSPVRRLQAQALMDRVRTITGPVLSDDMVLVRRVGKEVGLEPAILAELATRGVWPERDLVAMLRTHAFGAVVTAYDPGDPTFDARYLPATQAAMLAAYPRVEVFGDYRLRLPAK